MNATVQEHRQYPRKIVEQSVEVLDNETGSTLGYLEDVSREGFGLVTSQPVSPLDVKQVTLNLPGPQGNQYTVRMIAQCIWCQPRKESSNALVGFQLRDIDEQNAVALNYFIRDYKVSSEQQ